MISHHRFALTLAILFAALLCVATAPAIAQQTPPASSHGDPKAAKVKNPVPMTPESIAAGRLGYWRNCESCHGASGKGDGGMAGNGGLVPDFTDPTTWRHGGSDGEIFNSIRNGVSADCNARPVFLLSDTDVWNLVNFIRSIGPQPKQPAPSPDSKQSKEPEPSK